MINPLRKKRESMGLSQQALADELDITVANISRYENGKRFPNLTELLTVARAYKLTNEELLSYIAYADEIKDNK